MLSKDYVKHKRKMFPVPSLNGFMYSHYFTQDSEFNQETKKVEKIGDFIVSLSLSFIYQGSIVVIHSNTDKLQEAFDTYVKKISLIKQMSLDIWNHISTGKGPLVRRDFLNDPSHNDGFGATLFITADPDLESNYCIFEISSCYKKYRYGASVSVMKKYLQTLLAFISEAEEDLEKVKGMISIYLAEKKEDDK